MATALKRPTHLPSLDLGRFIAALLVAFFHISITVQHFLGAIPFHGIFRGGHSGVAYFFVLSGFIIFYVHSGDLGNPRRLGYFARKRVIRIIPVLWGTMIGWGLIRLYLPGGTTGLLDPWMILYDCFLLPHPIGDGVIAAVWTLRRELIFYLLFAVVIMNRRVGIGLLIAWQAAILVNLAYPFFALPPEPDMLLGAHNLGFGVGLLLAWALPIRPLRTPYAAIGLGVALYAAIMLTEWWRGNPSHLDLIPMGETHNTLLYLAASIVLVAGMVSLGLTRQSRKSPTQTLLGESSYALYLTHGPISSIAIRLCQSLWPHLSADLLTLLLVTVSVLSAIAINMWFEKPVARALRSWSNKRASHDSPAPTIAVK